MRTHFGEIVLEKRISREILHCSGVILENDLRQRDLANWQFVLKVIKVSDRHRDLIDAIVIEIDDFHIITFSSNLPGRSVEDNPIFRREVNHPLSAPAKNILR